MNESKKSLYPTVQQQQYSFTWEQFDILLEALYRRCRIIKCDLCKAGTVEVSCVIHPGLSQRWFGPESESN